MGGCGLGFPRGTPFPLIYFHLEQNQLQEILLITFLSPQQEERCLLAGFKEKHLNLLGLDNLYLGHEPKLST